LCGLRPQWPIVQTKPNAVTVSESHLGGSQTLVGCRLAVTQEPSVLSFDWWPVNCLI